MRMSAEFLPLYRLCGTSISSIAHSWKGRLYSVKRFQSAYARREMILPFSSNRSSTSLISKALYCASLTPRAMFSKSMNSASLRSPFIHDVLSCAEPLPRPRVSLSLSIICRRARSHEEVVTALYVVTAVYSGGRRRAPGAATRRARPRARPRRPVPAGRAKALLLEERQVGARLRVPGRQSAWLLGAERIPHARRPLERRAILRPGDARDADDARGGRAQAPRAVIALRGGGGLAGLGKTLAANPPPPLSASAAAVLVAAAHA